MEVLEEEFRANKELERKSRQHQLVTKSKQMQDKAHRDNELQRFANV
jgi:hypothetical protein